MEPQTSEEPKKVTKKKSAPPTDARVLALQTEAARQLMAQLKDLGVDDDKQVVADMIEGETNLEEAITNVLHSIDDDAIIIDGIAARAAELGERAGRAERRIESKRALIEQALMVAQTTKMMLPIATISLGKRQGKAVVEDESKLPTRFFKTQDPVLDKGLLTTHLREREKAIEGAKVEFADNPDAFKARMAEIDQATPALEGASLTEGEISLSVRRK